MIIRNQRGLSPLDAAAEANHSELEDYLRSKLEGKDDGPGTEKNSSASRVEAMLAMGMAERDHAGRLVPPEPEVLSRRPGDPTREAYLGAVLAAVRHNRIEEVEYALGGGLPVGAADSNGQTMLHVSSQNGHLKLTSFLLEIKADPNMVTNAGKTAVDFASQFKYDGVLALLFESLAISPRNSVGPPPLKPAQGPTVLLSPTAPPLSPVISTSRGYNPESLPLVYICIVTRNSEVEAERALAHINSHSKFVSSLALHKVVNCTRECNPQMSGNEHSSTLERIEQKWERLHQTSPTSDALPSIPPPPYQAQGPRNDESWPFEGFASPQAVGSGGSFHWESVEAATRKQPSEGRGAND